MNIFNDSSEFVREASGNLNPNATFTQVVTEYLVAENAAIDNLNVDQSAVFTGGIETNALKIDGLNNGDILISDASSNIDGLNIGPNKNVLVSNGTQPAWTNAIDVNQVTSNSIKINGTSQGDLLTIDNTSNIARLPISISGYFLISDGTNPQWEPIPDPFIMGSAQINNNLQLVSFPNQNLFTNSSGFVVAERSQLHQLGAKSFNSTSTQIYGTQSWAMTNNAWYKLSINLFTSNTVPFHGIVQLSDAITTIQLAAFNYDGNNLATVTLHLILKNNFATGTLAITIIAQTTSGTATLSDGTIFLERISEPIEHV